MNNPIIRLSSLIPTIISNTHLNITLQGWPAAISFLGLCGTVLGVHAIDSNNKTPESESQRAYPCEADIASEEKVAISTPS